jgi:hypothetical protein
MKDRYRLIRTEYDGARYHFKFDTEAKTLNGFTVCLPPYVNEPGLLVAQREGKTMDETFAEALTTLAYLRGQPFPQLYAPDQFVPVGIITAVDCEDVARITAIYTALIDGGMYLTDEDRARIAADSRLHEDGRAHERRVAALYRALALSRGAPLPSGSMSGWDNLTTLQ